MSGNRNNDLGINDLKLLRLEQEDSKLILELDGEDHTLGNLIAKALLREKGVTYAGYRVEHPLKSKLIIEVATDGKIKPLDMVKNVIKKLLKLNNEFREQFLSAITSSEENK